MLNYPKLKFKIHQYKDETEGEFLWSKSRNKIFERFYDADEITEPDTAIYELQKIIKDDPEFIDAYNSIGWWELDLFNYGNAYLYFMNAFRIGDKLVPKNYNGKIMWGITGNRPFLRSMHGMGVAYLSMHEWEKSSKIFKKILRYNPIDNQGVRALAIQSYIAQGKFEDVLKVCKMYPDDILPDTLYGAVYANYRLEKIKNAEEALKKAIQFSSYVAKELLKTKHKQIESELPGSVSVGGEDEAYEYWERVGHYWTDPKIKKFIENGLNKWGK
ncbi:hypothetical protein JXQ31_01155 [candidate division KSB1 bacterium]|nr:hypothetical protein [candidate division KSB1 bacterium]